MPVVPSIYPDDLDVPQTALSAIGQYDVRATVMQMAMVGAGVANDGVVMKPYVVGEEQAPDLSTLSVTEPEPLSRAVSPAVARPAQRDDGGRRDKRDRRQCCHPWIHSGGQDRNGAGRDGAASPRMVYGVRSRRGSAGGGCGA